MADDPKKIGVDLTDPNALQQQDSYTAAPAVGGLDPSVPPQQFLGQVLNKTIGDKPQEGVQSIASPIDFLPMTEMAGMAANGVRGALNAAPRLLANEVGAVGPGVAQLVEEKAAQQVAKPIMTAEGTPLTNGASMYQQGTPFADAAKVRFQELKADALKNQVKNYADGGEVSPPAPQMPEASIPSEPQGINVFNPQGELVSIPAHQLQSAMSEGYTEAHDEDVHRHMAEQKYGGTGQQAIAAIEGAAQGIAGPLATGAELALGVPKEDILGREEANPGTNMLGQGAGLVGGSLIGTTETRALTTLPSIAEKIAVAGTKLLPEATTTFAKIGSAATKAAIENMVIQGSNETSKMILQDPKQSVETAIVDVGLAGLIGGAAGGAIGSVNPLWQATLGKKTDGILSAISDKVGGIEGQNANLVDQAITAAGLSADDVAPEIRAALTQSPAVQNEAQLLAESAGKSGLKYQDSLNKFNKAIGDQSLEALGQSPETIANLDNLDAHEVGGRIRDTIRNQIKEQYEPLAKSYENISNRFKKVELPGGIMDELTENVAKTLDDGMSPGGPASKLVTRVLKEVEGIKNLEQLRNYTSDLMGEISHFTKPEYSQIAPKLRGALNGAEESALNYVVEKKAPELLAEHLETNAKYRELKNVIGDINDRLKVSGGATGPKTFLRSLDEMDPETILNRLNPTNKADIIKELSARFPTIANEVRDYHLGKILKQASKYSDIGTVSPNALFKAADKLSPQMREFLIGGEASQKLKALQALQEYLPEKINKSGTAKALDGLLKHMPGTATGMGSLIHSQNLISAGIISSLTNTISRDIPDAMRLGLLKFLGSPKAIEPGAFKATVDYIQTAIKGEAAISRATKAVFKAGTQVLPQSMMPTAKDTEKLDKRLKALQVDPKGLEKTGGATGHYMPEHAEHMSATAASAVNYLNSIRPNNAPTTPLGKPLPVNTVSKAQYECALSIAQQPLTVLERMQKGTLTSKDVTTLKTLYPSLYSKFATQLTDHMTSEMAKGHSIPYNTRLGLSLFLGQALDPSMTPQAIMGAQPAPPAQPQQGSLKPSQQGVKSISKLPNSYETPAQSREQARQKAD